MFIEQSSGAIRFLAVDQALEQAFLPPMLDLDCFLAMAHAGAVARQGVVEGVEELEPER